MIHRSLSFIEDNLRNDIRVDDMANEVCCSQSHFSRLFRSATGFSAMDFLRKRRLSLAFVDLLKRDRRVIDLALDYGFSYEQSFIRAFKKEFALTPGRLEQHDRAVPLTLDIVGPDLYGGFSRQPGFSIQAMFIPEQQFCGVNYAAQHHDNEELLVDKVGFFLKYSSPKIPDCLEGRRVYTVDGFLPHRKNYFYFVGLRCTQRYKPGPGFACLTLPSGIYYNYRTKFKLEDGVTIEQQKLQMMHTFYQSIIQRNKVRFGSFFFHRLEHHKGSGTFSLWYQLQDLG
ncbi:MAG: helix-turn-helix transcriptional regulator [Phycisphaerae bacterium]|nr:helix-turn-helix transcriptional regulator [Saprospiraceae bacterium]